MFDALEDEWKRTLDKFVDDTSPRFSALVDETLDEIFSGSKKYRPHKLWIGHGTAMLDVAQMRGDEEVIEGFQYMCDDEEDDEEMPEAAVQDAAEIFLTDVAMATGYHDPFPAEYRGKYA